MADHLSSEKRSWNMSRIRATNTHPEIIVRKYIFSLGYRYRLHGKKLPGKPDLVFAKKKKVIFVHGCFWHHHQSKNCKNSTLPKTNKKYWIPKLEGNIRRDQENLKKLKKLGWNALIIWECEAANVEKLGKKITRFLS